MPWLISSISRLLYCNYDLTDFIWLLLLHCFIATIIWLVSPIPGLFYRNYYSVAFFYLTTVLLRLRFGWFNFGFYYTIVLWQLWFGWCLLLQQYFIAVMIWLLSSVSRLFDWKYYLGESIWLLLHHCFISTMISLISSIAPLFYCNSDLRCFFCCTTILLQV